VQRINEVAAVGNRYFQDKQPGAPVKKDKAATEKVLGFALQIVRNLSILLAPITPSFSEILQSQLGLKRQTWEDIGFYDKEITIKKPKIIFSKLQPIEAGSKGGSEVKHLSRFPLNLKVGEITSAKEHPKADRLVVMQVNLGPEKRQIVAGIKNHYKPKDLIGKRIVIVCNLRHAKLRGIDSDGMLLAGCTDDESELSLVEAPNSLPGEEVIIDGEKPYDKEISFDQFLKLKINADKGKVTMHGKPLHTEKEDVACKVRDGCRVR
jgi:methionyl-tRNA synthetase